MSGFPLQTSWSIVLPVLGHINLLHDCDGGVAAAELVARTATNQSFTVFFPFLSQYHNGLKGPRAVDRAPFHMGPKWCLHCWEKCRSIKINN